jgi:hypothetical protein
MLKTKRQKAELQSIVFGEEVHFKYLNQIWTYFCGEIVSIEKYIGQQYIENLKSAREIKKEI